MPKYLCGKVVVRTFETYADSAEEATAFIKKWEEGETEDAEPGVKATSYKLFWEEFDLDNPTEERNKVLAAFLNLIKKIPGIATQKIILPPTLGPTGKFPQGKISPADEGELQLGVTVHKGNVIISFGKPIAWLGMPPKETRQFANALLSHANQIQLGG